MQYNLLVMNSLLIKWPGKISNFKQLVMDYPESKWPKPGIEILFMLGKRTPDTPDGMVWYGM